MDKDEREAFDRTLNTDPTPAAARTAATASRMLPSQGGDGGAGTDKLMALMALPQGV